MQNKASSLELLLDERIIPVVRAKSAEEAMMIVD